MLIITDTFAKKKQIDACLREAGISEISAMSCDGPLETYDHSAGVYRLLQGKATIIKRIRDYCTASQETVALMTGDPMMNFSLAKRLCLGIRSRCVAGDLPEHFTARDVFAAVETLKPVDMEAVKDLEKTLLGRPITSITATADDGNLVYTDTTGAVYKEYKKQDHSVAVQRFEQTAFDVETLLAVTHGSYYVGKHKNDDAFVQTRCPNPLGPEKILITWGLRHASIPASKNGKKIIPAALPFIF